MRFGVFFATLILAGLTGAPAVWATGSESAGAWSERVQVIYLDEEKSIVRRKVRVWDNEPTKDLDFVWEPSESGTLAYDGTVNGKGRLVWRIRGSASYDTRAIYSTYTGTLKDGRPHGQGRLQFRSGELFEGSFVAGLLEGQGLHIDVPGNRYEGDFRSGRPHGEGRLAETNGEIYVGSFANGLKHGKGESRLAGGASYASRWSMGHEVGRPEILADATLGGLLKTQSGGGDAGKVELSVAIEPRMTQQAADSGSMTYQYVVRDEDIAIYPADEQINNLWNGTGEVADNDWLFENRDWDAPAYVAVDLSSTSGERVELDKLELQVAGSEAYRKPMLVLMPHRGCTGFRPSFSLKNFGWGEARDASISFQFTRNEKGGPGSRMFTRPVGNFDEGIDVGIRDVFEEAGVDTRKLDEGRYSCPSRDALSVCRSQVFNDVGFGEIADFVEGDFFLTTTAAGTLNYTWQDDAGNSYPVAESFRAEMSLAYIELPSEAECGDGYAQSPEALRYQEVSFPVGKRDYTIELPVRGNKKISKHVARLKLDAEPNMTSFHQFNVAARFADGSVKKSKPVSFYFMHPRLSDFSPGMKPPVCTLSEFAFGC